MSETQKIKTEMSAADAVAIYIDLENQGVPVWIDGGWCVDALVGKQLRPHNDMDIAIEWKYVQKLREVLSQKDYVEVRNEGQWNFVLADNFGHEIDVHAFVFDDKGQVVDGIMYPSESLTGTGIIEGHTVRCISPKSMVEFLAPWIHKWPNKYLQAVSELCAKFSIELPAEYKNYKE